MLKRDASNRKCFSNYSQSFSHLQRPPAWPLELKELYMRKSLFNPPPGLAESYATRNHIVGAEVPPIEVLESSKRWLLLQTPKYSQNFFTKINSGHFINPFEAILRVFKSFAALGTLCGFYLPSPKMIFVRGKEICVWVNQDVFSREVQNPLRLGPEAQKQFVLAFLELLERQIKQWQRVTNVFNIEECINMLEWRIKIRRGSLTAVHASRQVFHRPNDSTTSFEPHQLKYYSDKIKGCMSVQDLQSEMQSNIFHEDLSSSYTLKEEGKSIVPKQVKHLLNYNQDMKNSMYEEVKPAEVCQQIRRTKKKFNLTSTSSTLQKFSQKLSTTIGRKALRIKHEHTPPAPELKKQEEPPSQIRSKGNSQHKSEPFSIANELDGLFADEKKHEFRLGEEGDREHLEKIAQEIQEVLIW